MATQWLMVIQIAIVVAIVERWTRDWRADSWFDWNARQRRKSGQDQGDRLKPSTLLRDAVTALAVTALVLAFAFAWMR